MRKLSAILVMLSLTSCMPALAKKSDSNSDESKSKDKKQVLVDQIIEAVQAENKFSEDELAALKQKQHERMDRVIDVIADKAKMSDEEKAKLKAKIAAKKEDHHEMPPELKAKLEERFDFKNFSKQTTYQVLADHFDDSDLKAILKFFKSPTGQKMFRQAPDMVGQVIELSAEKYVPIIMDMLKEMKDKLPPGLRNPDSEHKKEMMEHWRQFLKDKIPQPIPSPSGPGKDET